MFYKYTCCLYLVFTSIKPKIICLHTPHPFLVFFALPNWAVTIVCPLTCWPSGVVRKGSEEVTLLPGETSACWQEVWLRTGQIMVLERGGEGWNRSLNRRGVNKQGIWSFGNLFREGDGGNYHNDDDKKKLQQEN